jgi:hypothetical protein
MLVEVFRLDDLAAASRILGEVRVSLVVVARVGPGLARISGRPDARRARMRWSLLILVALRPEWPSARTLVQGDLRFLRGTHRSYAIQPSCG